jgi:hypothetical protein
LWKEANHLKKKASTCNSFEEIELAAEESILCIDIALAPPMDVLDSK